MLVNKKTGEIFVYGPIGESFFEEGVTDEAVVMALAEIGDKRVTVRINSPGGDADMGIAIYNTLKRHGAGVDTVVDSIAASAASIVALAGETRSSATGSKWMIHRALTFAVGNSGDMRKLAEILDKYDESLAEIYAEVTTMGKNAILEMMDAETWFSASEAVTAGLANKLGDVAPADIEPAVAAWYRNPPQSVAASQSPIVEAKFPVLRQTAKAKNQRYVAG